MATDVSSSAATGNPHQQQSTSEQQEAPNFDKAETQPNENQQPKEVVDKQTPTTPVNGGPTHKEEADKEQSSGSKGLARFLPGWLKRPKSQISEEESGKEIGVALAESNTIPLQQQLSSVEQTEVKEQGAPIADQELDDNIEEEATLDLHSLSSAETQPAQEEKEDLVPEKDPVIKDEVELETSKEKQDKSAEPELKTSSVLKPPPKNPKTMRCKVTLLDETEFQCDVERHSKGHELFTKVCQHLNLLEKDYFGLAIWDSTNQRSWLDLTKEIKKQFQGGPWDFTFNVKFYPPDPAQLTEDITRYYLCLQLRQDIITGCLPCSFVTLALLGSYTVQSELGEYDPELQGTDYVSEFKLAPNQTKELEEKIMELHKTHRAMTPAQADLQFLENAKKLSMYGVDFHPAKDLEGVDIMLGVCSGGLLVYKDRLRINRFAWPKVLKISYKRSSFFIKIRPGEDQCESTIGFKLPNYRAAKKLWKVCVENHTFFRLTTPESTAKSKFLSLGSKFRYSGRTQAQTREASALIDRPAPRFERTASKRASRSLDGAKRKFPKTSVELPMDEDLEPRRIAANREQPAAVAGTPDRSPRAVTSVPTIIQSHSVEVSSPATAETRVTESKAAKEDVKGEVKQEERLVDKKRSEPVQEVKQVVAQQTEIVPIPTTTNEKTQQKPDGEEEVVRMRKDLDKTQDEIMKHHASISELKRSFMESVPEPRPNEWDKRLSAHSPFRTLNINGKIPSGTEGKLIEGLYGHVRTNEKTTIFQTTYFPYATPEKTIREGQKQTPNNSALLYSVSHPQPPLVKTQTVTISDMPNSENEIATNKVPVVHTETKTITYEAAQTDDGNGDCEPAVLMSAQTITSETVSTTTTTQITKTIKGGISETRIEKRIVISGDTDVDHDQALAQAIKEAKEQHPDMSVTKVVVHQETEVAEE
ncbi:protein 4.1-like isoform X3 [Scyliorhinus canicula]|uniref:protein 4.1-like isoform X3 n=1 Tax=Scyliorhinus canicula TaxID=7830 RepID=UPI0018F3F501|nr:protein 4.1-like isoform X3 [Scyliorhinus canicula]